MWPRVLAEQPRASADHRGGGTGGEQPCGRSSGSSAWTGAVQFLGYLGRDDELLGCYQAADAFVFASRTETQGLVLLEALAQGTPVVSTAVMGTIDVLAGCGGSIVVEEEPIAFAAAVVRVLGNAAERGRLSLLARSDARRWSSRAMAERLIELYRTLRTYPAALPVAARE